MPSAINGCDSYISGVMTLSTANLLHTNIAVRLTSGLTPFSVV